MVCEPVLEFAVAELVGGAVVAEEAGGDSPVEERAEPDGELASRAQEDQAIWLMTEALAGTTAVADFKDQPNNTAPTDDPWAMPPGWGKRGGTGKREWFTELVNRAVELRHAATPRPYWPQRPVDPQRHWR